MSESKSSDEQDVLVEVIINNRDVLQFYSTQEYYKTLYEDREALINTVKTAFKEGVLTSVDVKNVEDIQSVRFLSEVVEDNTEVSNPVEEIQVEGEFEEYEVIEEPAVENITSSEFPEEVSIDDGLTPADDTDDRLNICPNCTYRTFNVGHFKIHMRQHTGESPFECNFCDYKSKQKSNLKRHLRHHLEGKDHFECKMCDFTCSQEKVFKRHMVLHSRSKPLRACPFCDYYSTSLAHLTVHIRQHTGETPYHCGLCSYKTVQKSNLTRHLKKHRRGRISKADKLRCCVYCSYRTPNPAHLLAHIRAAHTGETPYVCNMCDYKSAQRSNLKRHLRKHSGERPFRCHLCKYSTAYPYVLKKHIENHPSVENLRCSQCDFVTNSTAESKRHARIHSGKTLFCCHICGYLSLNSDHLKAHLRSHSKEKPYKCHFCSYCSVQKSNLKRHLLIKHSGAKKPKSNETPHSTEDPLENDKSNEGSLHIDDTEEHYTDVENDNVQSKRGGTCVKEEPFECETILETAEEVDAADVRFVNPNASESMNDTIVANEEHIITSVVDETDYEVMEEYADGVVVNGATVECMSVEQEIEEPHKPKLDFLNKSQTEKLKEFKRLLQEGTQFSQPGSQPRSRQIHSRKRSAAGSLEEKKIVSSEDLGLSGQGEVKKTVMKSAKKTKLEYVQEHSPYKSSDSSDQMINKFKGSSILIVDHPRGTTNDNDNSELYEDSMYEEEYMDDYENTNDSGHDELCELCGFTARSRSELKVHIAIHTGEVINNIYKCELCPFKSTRKNDLGRHKTLIHGATPPRMLPFICAICNFRSDSKENLLVHCKTHSNYMVKCKICEEKCQTAKELMNHCKKHIGEEPFECYFCGYFTARKYQLRKHVRRKHGTEKSESTGISYKCYTCGYQTDLRKDFYKHRGEHITESEGPKGYKCPHCLFYCFDNKVLDTHLKAHFNGNMPGANNVDTLGNISPGINTDVEGRRTPLKEFPSNASESDNTSTKQTTSKVSLLNTSPKKFLREDFIPIKKRRRGLKSLLLGNRHGGSSLIEERLNRKFNFDVKNLCPSDEENDSGFDVELTGEVVKSHGSLRKYSNYGEIISKSQTELATVMANIDNEDNLKVVLEQIKELESQMLINTNLDEIEFTIYFKDIDESSLKPNNETISDLDDILSSGDETDHMNDDNDILTDSDTELSDSNLRQSRSAKESAKKDSFKPQVLCSLDELDESHLKEKIMEQNRKRGELRRQKILSLSNPTKPTNGPMKTLKNDKGQEEHDENMLIIDE